MKSGIDSPRSVRWADAPLDRILAVVGERVKEGLLL